LRSPFNDRGYNIEGTTPLCIYSFADHPRDSKVLCKLEEDAQYYASKEDCQLCKADSKPLNIDPKLYYLKDGVENYVMLGKSYFETCRSFLSRFGDLPDALRVHRTDRSGDRHHAFDINIAALLQSEEFVNNFHESLRAVPFSPEVIVAPNHSNGRNMARIASALLGCPVVIHNDLRPDDQLLNDDRRMLESARRILVLDDAINSGTRMDSFNRSLREHFGELDDLCFLTAMARTESAVELKDIETQLTKAHPWRSYLRYVEKCFLPRWDAEECPWCLEYDFLANISVQSVEPPKWLTERLSALIGKEDGLSTDPLLMLPTLHRPLLGHGSPISRQGSSEMSCLFAVVSALQSLRSADNDLKRLSPRFPVSNVFGLRNLKNYSEGLVRAVLLRSVKPQEWGDRNSRDVGQFLTRSCQASGQNVVLGELLFAAQRGMEILPLTRGLRASYTTLLGGYLSDFETVLKTRWGGR